MFLIRPTKSLTAKLGVRLSDTATSSGTTPLAEWYANDFRLGRTEFVLWMNPETNLPIVMKAAPYRELPARLIEHLPEYLKRLGYSGTLQNLGLDAHAPFQFSRTQDRSVLGVMTEFIRELEVEHQIGRADLAAPLSMSLRLASGLVRRGPDYQVPLEIFQKLVGTPVGRGKGHLRIVT